MEVVGLLIAVTIGIVIGLPLLKIQMEQFIKYRAQNAQIAELDPLLANLQRGKPAVIYFTGAWCGPCKLMQTPVIQQLAREKGESLQILEVDINQQLDVAQRWGVMKVPRTFVLDHNLHIYASNLDVARLDTLRQQIAEAEQNADHPQPMKLVQAR